MDYVVFIHDPDGYHRGHKRELQGGNEDSFVPYNPEVRQRKTDVLPGTMLEQTPTLVPTCTTESSGTQLRTSLEIVDIVVLVLYFLFVLAVGFWVGASLFASNVGSGHFVGLAGSGAASGIAVTAYEWNVTTMPEYLQRRFGGSRIQILLAILYLFIYIFTKISVDIYAGAMFIQQALQWDLYLAIVGLLAITAVYTVAGGLAAVIYTDALQTVFMLLGGLILMGFSFAQVGGFDELQEKYHLAIPTVRDVNTSCGLPREDAFHIFRDPVTSDLPWPGVLVGMTIPSIWYWCTDQVSQIIILCIAAMCLPVGHTDVCIQLSLQVIVQRSLAAKNLLHAKGGSLLASYLKVLPFFMMVLPGMISRILFTGLRGLMMSVMIAALMSSLTSIFNSSATIFTMDVWRFCRPRSSEWELMIVGRVFVLVLVVISVLWIPLVKASQGGQLFIYIQSISSYLQPPVAIVFIAGCFWKRTNERGAFCALVLGLLAGCVRMVLDMVYPAPQCHEEDSRPAIVRNVHYLYFSVIVSAFTLVVVLVISLTSEPPSQQQMSRLTWFTRFDKPPQGHVENESVGEDGEADVPGDGKDGGSGGTVSESSWNQKLKAAFMWLCGLQRQDGHKAPCPPKPAVNIAVLEEDPLMKHMVNANLLVCMSLAVFLWAYFA
ncbi:SC5AB protein, partial [Polypterus senegalus]